MEEDIKILEELIAGAKAYGEYEGNKYFKSMEHLIARNKELEEINADLLVKLEMKKILFLRKDKTTNKIISELYIRKDVR